MYATEKHTDRHTQRDRQSQCITTVSLCFYGGVASQAAQSRYTAALRPIGIKVSEEDQNSTPYKI